MTGCIYDYRGVAEYIDGLVCVLEGYGYCFCEVVFVDEVWSSGLWVCDYLDVAEVAET